MSFVDTVRRGLRLIRTFDGRDTRAQFWPYCGAVLGVWFVVGNVLFVAAFIATSLSATPRSQTAWPFIAVTGATFALLVALLASAVTRRLRDRDHSGAWALIPVALVCSGLAIFSVLFATFDDDMGPGLFLAGFANNLLYFATMITLTVQLAMPSAD
ncbi:MAG: DUF805 domain-containing protein [Aeromicrobium sp.]